jgi:ribokinase
MSNDLLVVGSLNMDLVVQVPHHPHPGETVLGSDYLTFSGGKGANQAVAAARAGAGVEMLGLVGSDPFGPQLHEAVQMAGVGTTYLKKISGPSGIALISINPQGENMIVVSPGANAQLTPEQIPTQALRNAGMIMMQMEIPIATVRYVTALADEYGIPVLLNPAPLHSQTTDLLNQISLLVLNETEASQLLQAPLSSPEQALAAAQQLRQRGTEKVVITLGAVGLVYSAPEGHGHLPAFPVSVVDTTAAGDGFCGALAAALVTQQSWEAALSFAAAAAALTVTRHGAQASLPTHEEITDFLRGQDQKVQPQSPLV